jgi:hypothetical protein
LNKNIIFGFLLTLWLLPFVFSCGGGGGGSSDSKPNGTSEPGSVTLTWDAPTTNADGSPLDDLAGYKVYYGYPSRNYTDFIDVGMPSCQTINGKTNCTYTVSNLSSGEYYFAVTAYDISGNMSMYSNEAVKSVK